ncbi:Rieske 2Fe-2S domain-containing protein [Streptomyces osmaniensis]|uniref:Rieske-type oxygenase n=1 Tax=Streptomyces osmaniensis TaxID=593134 RepID=A0ABP6Z3Z9_9ACTN
MSKLQPWRDHQPGKTTPTSPYVGTGEEAPLGYATGWVMLLPLADLPPRSVRTVRLNGGDVVVYRTTTGMVRVTRPFCPHLGAHIGHGGHVEGEAIVCPFHGFSFSTDGVMCKIADGYDALPSHRTLQLMHHTESAAAIYVWTGQGEPTWPLPELLPPGSTTPTYSTVELSSHPQELMENSVDLRHTRVLHNFEDHRFIEEPVGDGPHYRYRVTLRRRFPPFGRLTADISVILYGLGVLRAYMKLPTLGLTFSAVMNNRQIAPWRVHLIMGTSMAFDLDPTGPARHLTPAMRAKALRILSPVNHHMMMLDLMPDLPVWENKRYTAPPHLAKGDGPIGHMRKWAEQFYDEADRKAQNARHAAEQE